MLFAEAVAELPPWAAVLVALFAAVAALSVPAGMICTIILQLLARKEAARVAEHASLDAGKAQQSAALAASEAGKAKAKAEEVKVALAETTTATAAKLDDLAAQADRTQKTGEKVHSLVNGAMSEALKVAAVALRRVAGLTAGQPGHDDDVQAAENAERAFREHEAKQAGGSSRQQQ